MESKNNAYWDGVLNESSGGNRQDLWRASMQEIFRRLMDRWIDGPDRGTALKTDLYDEAVSSYGLMPLLSERYDRVLGIDVSFEVASAVRRRMSAGRIAWDNAAVADVRNLPFRSNSFSLVLSHSTLDHFSDRHDIAVGIREIFRVLKPGGLLIITLDNPSNPVVYLRNLLPFRLLKSLGIIPYYMGVTLCRRELVRGLESNGFMVSESTAVEHGPRIFLIWLGRILSLTNSSKIQNLILGLFRTIECLERLPTRFLTGYYIAVKAVKK